MSDTTVAISSLHLIKNHPEYLKKIEKREISYFFKNLLIKIVKIIKVFFQFSDKGFLPSSKKVKVLFVSHLTNKNQIYDSNDPYYGPLKKICNLNKITNFRLLLNHIDINEGDHNRSLIKKNTQILSRSLSFKFEFRVLKKKFLELYKLRQLSKNLSDKFSKKILKKAMISLFDPETTFALRTKIQLKNFLSFLKPDIIIVTYEGYGWERLCFKAAKEFNKNIKCIGYQHAPVGYNHLSIKKIIKTQHNPDLIWCSNKQSYKILKSSKALKKIKIVNVGNLKKKFTESKSSYNKKNYCLVIPEGIYSECLKLFSFTIKCAKENKSIKFIWRLHPIIELKKIFKLLDINKNSIPKNIIISSEKNIFNDIKKSKFVLYRGSGSVIESVIGGNIPLYFKNKEVINIDPLKGYNKKENYINSYSEFLKRINYYSNNEDKKVFQISKKIGNLFYEKINRKKIIESLKT